MVATIQVRIPDSLAQIYENASQEDKQKAQWLIELVLHDLFQDRSESLTDVMQAISKRAQERGLTPDDLDALLRDDE
ncbi:MAG: hypothetical protein CL610_01440 [Anaerolineaceae bacterium]|nr:hypothetical protein [Anaerolineaceae bacterium]